MKIKRPKKYVISCKQCGTVSHTGMKNDCPYCGAIGQGERLPVNALPTGDLLKLDSDIIEVNSI